MSWCRFRAVFTLTPSGGGSPIVLHGEETSSLAIARNDVVRLRQTKTLAIIGNAGWVQKSERLAAWQDMDFTEWNPNATARTVNDVGAQ